MSVDVLGIPHTARVARFNCNLFPVLAQETYTPSFNSESSSMEFHSCLYDSLFYRTLRDACSLVVVLSRYRTHVTGRDPGSVPGKHAHAFQMRYLCHICGRCTTIIATARAPREATQVTPVPRTPRRRPG